VARTAVFSLHERAPGGRQGAREGNIETLRSGALRVRVYAGIDPVTKRRHNLIEVVDIRIRGPGDAVW
jgi:hypothetical protein